VTPAGAWGATQAAAQRSAHRSIAARLPDAAR
jgi:hypothetical protein